MSSDSPGQPGATETLLQVGQKVGNYRVVRQLGQGGMGAVFEAVHTYIERRAAIKVLHPDLSQNPQFATRFLNEARAVNLIQHAGLVEIFEFGILDNGTAYIIMEFLAGEALTQRMRRAPENSHRETFAVARQIAQAMAAAHAKGIVHRDLKPDNVMVLTDASQPSGIRTKVLDFGIAKLSSNIDGQMRTETGAMIGTPAYMSPEQCLGASNVDGKADVYALGVMLYEMLAFRLPFECQHSFDFMAAHVRDTPQPLHQVMPEVPQEIEDLVHSMLAKDPALRPSMEAVVSMLGEVQALWNGSLVPGVPRRESRELMALSATVSGPNSDGRVSGRQSGGPLASGRRASKEDIELGATFPGAISMDRRVSREAITPLAPPPTGAAPVESRSNISIEPAHPSSAGVKAVAANRPRLFVALGGVLVCGVIALLLLRKPAAVPPPPARVEPATVAPRIVRWNVVSIPPGAEVRSDGKSLGNTPWELERPAGTGETALTLHLQGYQDKTIVLNHSTEVQTEVRLVSLVAPAPATAPATSAPEPAEAAEPASRRAAKSKSAKSKKDKSKNGDVKLLID